MQWFWGPQQGWPEVALLQSLLAALNADQICLHSVLHAKQNARDCLACHSLRGCILETIAVAVNCWHAWCTRQQIVQTHQLGALRANSQRIVSALCRL